MTSIPKKILIPTFILLNIVSMFGFLLPQESKFVQAVLEPVRALNRFAGIHREQSYLVVPADGTDRFMTAMIAYADGTSATYEFEYHPEPTTRPSSMAIRFRNLTSFAKSDLGPVPLWRDMAKFALKKLGPHSKKVIRVEVHRHWSETPSPEKDFQSHEILKNQFKSSRLYTFKDF